MPGPPSSPLPPLPPPPRPPRQRKSPSKRTRRAAALLAVLLVGGLAAVGFAELDGGHSVTTGAASLNATTATVPGQGTADGAASALPELVGQPTEASMPTSASPSATHRKRAKPTASRSAKASPSASASASPSPTSSSPPSPVGGGACTNPVYTTSTLTGTFTQLPYFVANNMWNVGSASASQTLSACSASAWNVSATFSGGGNSVKTYPNSHLNYDNPPAISSLKSVSSTFAETSPGTGVYEDAYDIWLNGVANPSVGSDEVMIWTQNNGQIPAGSPTTTVTFDGQAYTVWKGTNGPVSFVANSTMISGTLNLLQFFQWLINKGWVPSNSTLAQVDYGVEIVTTNGQPENFGFSDFSVSSG